MSKFRKKPVVIEAVQWDGTANGAFEINEKLGLKSFGLKGGKLVIETLEGDMKASAGDWIIRGVQGEFYPCKPDIFIETYEPVEESD